MEQVHGWETMDRHGAELISPAWEGFRLSKQQDHVLAGGGLAQRTVGTVSLEGSFDRDVLKHAACDVVLAHESLRTAYRQVLGENSTVLMVIEDEPRVRLREASGDDAELKTLVREELRPNHDDGDEWAPRLTVFTGTGGRRSLVVSVPRVGMDEVSVEIFFRDLQQAYASRSADEPWSRDDIIQYADYAQWQFEEGTHGGRLRQMAADREARISALPPLNLPLELHSEDRARKDLEWMVPDALAQRLRSLGHDNDVAMRSILLTGWFVALWHATGRPERLAADTVLTRRPFKEVRTAIGQFGTAMPVFVDISHETSLSQLLSAVDQELGSFEQLDESLVEPARQHPLVPGFRFGDAVDFTGRQSLTFSDLRIEPLDDARKIGLSVQGMDGSLRLTLAHQALGMAEGGAEAILVCLKAALSALGGDLSVAVDTLPMLDDEAGQALVAATNRPALPSGPVVHWHRQVERNAELTPDGGALRTGTRTWSYRELDRTANGLADELIARGVGAGTLVGLCLGRSDLAIVAMLAIAKAGAGYVPIDRNLPVRRRTSIITSTGLTHAVATEESATDLPAGCDVLVLNEDLRSYAERGTERPAAVTADDDTAYVLFTSGSTGTPKGVRVGHGQLAAYLDGVLDRLGLDGAIDSVALSALGTDLGNTALFPPLISGGELLVVAPEVSADAQALAELLVQEEYDLLKITPSHLGSLISVAEEPGRLMPGGALVLGGEPFAWGWYNLFRRFPGTCRVFNHYGPTETTVGVLCGEVTSNDLATLASTVPLGTPMRHASAYVLDPQRRPLPAGLPGELWIGGTSVSGGYLDGTTDQRERFVADPLSALPGARMYRTGDKARFLPDGSLEFLGRIDRQIKVRGFRVELGEIESVMRQHPRVKDSIVVESGESTAAHLVGYVIDSEDDRGSAEWLREFLAERLPDFMVPTHLVALDSFPLTSTGKVDSNLLPEPGFYSQGSLSYVAPRTPTEAKVAAVMARLLLLNRAGADDDFFEIGGHSLLATQLIAELRDEFKVNLKLRSLFEYPVVSELAAFVDELLEKQAGEV
ncbi:amino acid adenylation domain-containing protein [Streptomyces albidoflavus]